MTGAGDTVTSSFGGTKFWGGNSCGLDFNLRTVSGEATHTSGFSQLPKHSAILPHDASAPLDMDKI